MFKYWKIKMFLDAPSLFQIILGLAAILTVVSCKDFHPHQHHVDHHHAKPASQRYRETKNKRGIEYPLGLSLGSPLQGIHPVPPVASPFAQGYSNFGGYSGGISNFAGGIPLGLNAGQFGAQSQPAAFSTLGAQSLGGLSGGYGLGQQLLLGQGSGYNAQPSNLNLANLLGIQESSSQPISLGQFSSFDGRASPISAGHPVNLGQFSSFDGRSSPISFASQGLVNAASQQSYNSVFAPSPQIHSSQQIQPLTFSLPIGMANPQISTVQQVAAGPSHATLSNLGSHSISLAPAHSNNIISYSTLSSGSNSPRDTSSHTASGSYMIAAPSQHQSLSSPTNFRLPVPSIVSSSSSPSYTIASLTSPPGTHLQLSTALSQQNRQPYREMVKIPESMGPSSSMVHSNPPSMSSGSPSSLVVNSPSSPDYSRNDSGSALPSSSGQPLTSYGTPAMTYTIPSTSYGTPTHSHAIPNSNQNSQKEIPSLSFTSAMTNYSALNPSSPFQTNSLKGPSSFSNPSTRYGPSSSSISFSAPNFKDSQPSPPSGISNSIDTYSASPYDDVSDTSSSYSSVSPRYTRYPTIRTSSYSETPEYPSSQSYDTISYSVSV
ncbi:hypothetical protein QAD02_008682 [Eretmocerus hayati]|uniref:Uncharacterized protein n=1 Tax=Eretmocerus hayati TaxID=131215 RepID=A0ACC2NBM4_9HYME|nr:hypothetical protein QAD02_008682 [Eretmocerus hayati]